MQGVSDPVEAGDNQRPSAGRTAGATEFIALSVAQDSATDPFADDSRAVHGTTGKRSLSRLLFGVALDYPSNKNSETPWMPDHPAPTVIPLPANFPITWEPPELADLLFMQDRMHAPAPITPLSGWLNSYPFADGANRGFATAGQPLMFVIRRYNTYYYVSVGPSIPPEEMEAAGRRAEETLKELLPTFADRWDNEWLAEVKGMLDHWSQFDLSAASDAALLEHMDDALEKFARLWDIHFIIAPPFHSGPSMFVDMYNDLLEPNDPLEVYELLYCDHNMSLEVGYALWDLSQKYVDVPAVAEPLRSKAAGEALSDFGGTDEGRRFLVDLDEALDQYGHRSDGIIEVADLSWTEDPGPALTVIRENMDPDATDPRADHEGMVRRRDESIAAARSKISGYPQPVRDQFESLLSAGRDGQRVQEDHNFWIDQNGVHYMRQIFLEIGSRLAAADAIDAADDVFYLEPDQIRLGLAGGADYGNLVAHEKSEMARWAKVTPPPVVGTDHGPPPENPVGTAFSKFLGVPVAPSETPGEITGIAVSGGSVRGTARVIMNIREGERLKKGDILVAPTTAPPWTPLFGIASAVVTDTGGPLSHCGIVAREYGIPCVGGTVVGTTAIKDGQQIEVDGTAGTVRILS